MLDQTSSQTSILLIVYSLVRKQYRARMFQNEKLKWTGGNRDNRTIFHCILLPMALLTNFSFMQICYKFS